MNSKAQIASLDFILSVILVVVALGLTMQIIETNQYTMKEMEINNELERIGETAADILVSHPEFTCDVLDKDGDQIGNMELQNCIVKSVFKGKSYSEIKIFLGIPSNYEIDIDVDQGQFPGNPFNLNLSGDYYSANRIIAFWNPANETGPEKSKLNKCIDNTSGCGNFKRTFITIKVWKVT